jgi:phosphoglucomutase
MNALRNPAPAEIAGRKVVKFRDYQAQSIEDRVSGTVESTNLPKCNVLSFTLDNGDVIVARPSGTEPKIKFYFMLIGKDKDETVAKMEAYRESLGV